jgi:Molybdopterin-binding domain of aldehyde dehydrogenase
VLHGQAHGSGIGQALCEAVAYAPASGQLLSASFMGYALPRADTLPSFRTLIMEVPVSSRPHSATWVRMSEFRCSATASRLTSWARSHRGSQSRAKAGEGRQGGNDDFDQLQSAEQPGLDPGL